MDSAHSVLVPGTQVVNLPFHSLPIQEIGRYLRSYCHQHQHSWHRFLAWTEYAQNSLCQNTTGLTHPILVHTPLPTSSPPLVRGTFCCSSCAPLVTGCLQTQEPGQYPWLSHFPVPTRSKDLAFHPGHPSVTPQKAELFIGPFPIIRQINSVISSYHQTTKFHHLSMHHFLNLTLTLHLHPPWNLMQWGLLFCLVESG